MGRPLNGAGAAPPAAGRPAPESSKTLDRGIQLLEAAPRTHALDVEIWPFRAGRAA